VKTATSKAVREDGHPQLSPAMLQDVLDALADPVRRSIIRQLADSPDPISCGAFYLWISKSTSTYHFNLLRNAGIIRQYQQGTSKMNTLRKAELDDVFPGLIDAVLHATAKEPQR
jgi:DNA-binding transcriptional ArsR family regulator